MTHLYIELNTGLTEEVNSSIISKLYELAISGDLDNTSDLKGRLHSSTAKDTHFTYLNTNFEDLYITVDALYVTFTDPEVERVLMATLHIGDGIGITLADCATYGDYSMYGTPYQIFKANTTIEYFPEFKYFTYWINKANASTGLVSSPFDGCTNLKNIDITGMTSIPYSCFAGCSLSEFNPQLLLGVTELKQFAFLNSGISGEINLPALQTVGNNIFNACSNITKVLSLGTITDLKSYSFNKCTGLTQVALPTTCTMLRDNAFNECTNLTTIYEEGSQAVAGSLVLSHISLLESLVFSNTKITSADFTGCTFTSTGSNALSYCSNLTTVVLPNTCTQLGSSTFLEDTALLSVTGLNNITSISKSAFNGCSNLTNVDIDWSKITSIENRALYKCPIGAGLTLELNLTNQSSHFGDAFGKTEFDKIIVHCSWSGDGDGNHPPFINLPYTTYLDISDCILHKVNGYSLSHLNGDNSLVTVIYPPGVNQIRCGAWGFRNALGTFRYMIILNTTPPDINTDHNNPFSSQFSSNSILHIYVPDSAVSDYLADSKWSQLGGDNGTITILLRLHGLSELPAGVWTTGLASQYLTPAQLVTT